MLDTDSERRIFGQSNKHEIINRFPSTMPFICVSIGVLNMPRIETGRICIHSRGMDFLILTFVTF